MPVELGRDDRLRLMKFACAFAWADLEIRDAERRFVDGLIVRLELEDARGEILRWLKQPPDPEEVDPTLVPRAHREVFLDVARKLCAADGEVDVKEGAQLLLLEELLA